MAYSVGEDRIDCFESQKTISFEDGNWSEWSEWSILTDNILRDSLTCLARDSFRLDCFVFDTNSNLRHAWTETSGGVSIDDDGNFVFGLFLSNQWTVWENLGGSVGSSFWDPPECIVTMDRKFHCFIKGSDDDGLHHIQGDESRWSAWENLGGHYLGVPSCLEARRHEIHCFAVQGNHRLNHIWNANAEFSELYNWELGDWNQWEVLGEQLADDRKLYSLKSVECVGTNEITCFGPGYQVTQNNSYPDPFYRHIFGWKWFGGRWESWSWVYNLNIATELFLRYSNNIGCVEISDRQGVFCMVSVNELNEGSLLYFEHRYGSSLGGALGRPSASQPPQSPPPIITPPQPPAVAALWEVRCSCRYGNVYQISDIRACAVARGQGPYLTGLGLQCSQLGRDLQRMEGGIVPACSAVQNTDVLIDEIGCPQGAPLGAYTLICRGDSCSD